METLIPHNSMFLPFLAFFSLLYLAAYFVIFRGWSSSHRPDASSCFTSLFHGTPAVLLALLAILTQTSPGFAAPNAGADKLVLDFSIAYFVVDLLHYVVFLPSEYLFIAHHVATLLVFVTCRLVTQHGAFALLVLEVLAEMTSFLQNAWTLAGMRRADLPRAARVHKFLSLPFYLLYTALRAVLAPLFFYKMSAFYLRGEARDVVPMWVAVSWVVVIGSGILLSILWISNLWLEFFREMDQNRKMKQK